MSINLTGQDLITLWENNLLSRDEVRQLIQASQGVAFLEPLYMAAAR
jgi:hypothetical protein